MYEQLFSLGQEIKTQLKEYFPHKNHYGVSLDVDEYWDLSQMLSVINRYRDSEFYYRNRLYNYTDNPIYADEIRVLYYRLNNYPKVDLSFRPIDWESYCRNQGYPRNAMPVIIRVKPKETVLKERLSHVTIYGNIYPVIYESVNKPTKLISNFFKPLTKYLLPKLSLAPCIIVKTPRYTSGTIGGVLYGNRTGKTYLSSCAHVMHVIGNNVYCKNNNLTSVGVVRFSSIPELSQYDDPCNIDTNPDLHSLDVALAEITVPLNRINYLEKLIKPNSIFPIKDMRPNMKVSFVGKSSGRVDARLGALTIWDQIESVSGKRCFGRIFQLRSIEKQYLTSALAKPGDSGSWVTFFDGFLTQWCGVIIGSDGGGTAYACFAETTIREANINLNDDLRIFP